VVQSMRWLMGRNMKKKILRTGGYYWCSTNLNLLEFHALLQMVLAFFPLYLVFAFSLQQRKECGDDKQRLRAALECSVNFLSTIKRTF
jgi:FtsH-binding integral membrane protein